jgi:hypothetical protein
MGRTTEQFKLIRTNRSLYRFESDSVKPILFQNPAVVGWLDQKRQIDVQFEDNICSLSGTTTWPHDVRLTQLRRDTLTTSEDFVIGSQCYTWKSNATQFRIHPRKSDSIVGRHWAFHLWDSDRRLGYWQQRKAFANIEGIRTRTSDPLQIATIVFGFMFDWEYGTNWKL